MLPDASGRLSVLPHWIDLVFLQEPLLKCFWSTFRVHGADPSAAEPVLCSLEVRRRTITIRISIVPVQVVPGIHQLTHVEDMVPAVEVLASNACVLKIWRLTIPCQEMREVIRDGRRSRCHLEV